MTHILTKAYGSVLFSALTRLGLGAKFVPHSVATLSKDGERAQNNAKKALLKRLEKRKRRREEDRGHSADASSDSESEMSRTDSLHRRNRPPKKGIEEHRAGSFAPEGSSSKRRKRKKKKKKKKKAPGADRGHR